MKSISIIVPGAKQGDAVNIKDVSIGPGATVADVTQQAGLKDFVLRRQDGQMLAPGVDLHGAVEEGQKLFAAPHARVAGGAEVRAA